MMGSLQTFQDVVVVPYSHLLTRHIGGHVHHGGPIWPDWDEQIGPRFNRNGKPIDSRPELEQPATTIPAGNHVWIGPVHKHFGHGIGDFSTRIARSVHEVEDPVLVFSSKRRRPMGLVWARAWFRAMLEWYGVSRHQVLFVTRPTLFKRLSVSPQAEQLTAIGPTADYLDLLDQHTAERPVNRRPWRPFSRESAAPPVAPPITYVSRAGMDKRFGGEAYLERVLQASGVRVFRPERHGLLDQLAVYRTSSTLLFSEGSALHATQLLGRSLGSVVVLVRRTGVRFAEAFVRPRAQSLEYVDCTRGAVYGETAQGMPAPWQGITLLDESKLLSELSNLGIPVRARWDQQKFRAAVRRDVIVWLHYEARQPTARTNAAKDRICNGLIACGVPDLIEQAKRILRH